MTLPLLDDEPMVPIPLRIALHLCDLHYGLTEQQRDDLTRKCLGEFRRRTVETMRANDV